MRMAAEGGACGWPLLVGHDGWPLWVGHDGWPLWVGHDGWPLHGWGMTDGR